MIYRYFKIHGHQCIYINGFFFFFFFLEMVKKINLGSYMCATLEPISDQSTNDYISLQLRVLKCIHFRENRSYWRIQKHTANIFIHRPIHVSYKLPIFRHLIKELNTALLYIYK